MNWVNEKEPFPAFLKTCTDVELVGLLKEAQRIGDDVTRKAVLAELKRRTGLETTE